MFQGCPALAPWSLLYFIFSQIFLQDKTSKNAHEKIQFRHKSGASGERMRKDEKG